MPTRWLASAQQGRCYRIETAMKTAEVPILYLLCLLTAQVTASSERCLPIIPRDFGYFYTYWETVDSLRLWTIQFPLISSMFSAGRSHHGYELWVFKLSDNPNVEEGEPEVFFNAATHAREPMGVSICMDYIRCLLNSYGRDSLTTWLVNNRQILFIPVMNPDGYIYNSDSGGTTENWYKNRRPLGGDSTGVDLGRNYGYRGGRPYPFSEPETQVARDFMLPRKIRTQIDYHSYGSYILFPWSFSTAEPIPDSALFWEMWDSIRFYNQYPRGGPFARTMFPAPGSSIDWELADTLWNNIRKFVSFPFMIETNQTDFWQGWDDSTVISRNLNENRPVNVYLTKVAGVFFDWPRPVVADSLLGNSTGQLDPGERTHLWFFLRNRAVHNLDSACNISTRLASLDTMITVETATAVFPTIRRNSSGDSRFSRFVITCSRNAVPGSRKGLRLELTFNDDTCTIVQAVTCSLTIGNTSIAEEAAHLKNTASLAVLQNPTRSDVKFEASGLAKRDLDLSIYNISGQLIRTLRLMVSGMSSTFYWNRCDDHQKTVPPGVYFYRFTARDFSVHGKVVLSE